MKKLTPGEVTEKFNARRNTLQENWEKSGVAGALQDISKAVKNLKDGGADISMELFFGSGYAGFAMFKASMSVACSGLLRAGNNTHVVALGIKENGQDCLKLAVSVHDFRLHIGDTVESRIFDLKTDENALVAFQSFILNDSAEAAVIAQNDTHKSFDSTPKEDKLQKPRASGGIVRLPSSTGVK